MTFDQIVITSLYVTAIVYASAVLYFISKWVRDRRIRRRLLKSDEPLPDPRLKDPLVFRDPLDALRRMPAAQNPYVYPPHIADIARRRREHDESERRRRQQEQDDSTSRIVARGAITAIAAASAHSDTHAAPSTPHTPDSGDSGGFSSGGGSFGGGGASDQRIKRQQCVEYSTKSRN
jgi:uncharacterized membrane protein YgcG